LFCLENSLFSVKLFTFRPLFNPADSVARGGRTNRSDPSYCPDTNSRANIRFQHV